MSFSFFPVIRATENLTNSTTGTTSTQSPDYAFTARPSNDSKVLWDIRSIITPFDFHTWRLRGLEIRSGDNRAECYGSLSLALSEISSLSQAVSSGASGALTLLPTAGALIGARAKELWVLFKLVPVAGFLSMLLSLGGNIMPQHLTDYEETAFLYGGMIATDRKNTEAYDQPVETTHLSPKAFAKVVQSRAVNPHGSSKKLVAVIRIVAQLVWISVILVACYVTQSGEIVTWWCKAWGWMFLWYLMVAVSSLLENIAGVLFTKQWTMRVSKTPGCIEISDDAPVIVESVSDLENQNRSSTSKDSQSKNGKAPEEVIEMGHLRSNPPHDAEPDEIGDHGTFERPGVLGRRYTNFLQILDGPGINTTGRITMTRDHAWSASRHSFYVIISVAGIGHGHATLRVISKAISEGSSPPVPLPSPPRP